MSANERHKTKLMKPRRRLQNVSCEHLSSLRFHLAEPAGETDASFLISSESSSVVPARCVVRTHKPAHAAERCVSVLANFEFSHQS